MVRAGKPVSVDHRGVDSTSSKGGGGGINEFFSFYSQLQHSASYYSTLSLRQMMVGYQYPVGIGISEKCPLPVSVNSVSGKHVSSKGSRSRGIAGATIGKQEPSVACSSAAAVIKDSCKMSQVKVVVSACDTDSDNSEVAVAGNGSPRLRKVNFATPLSTIKIKSPTPMHSMEELNGNTDSTKTGFTSDSEMEGSETDIWCQYVWRVRNVQQGQLQVPSGDVNGVAKKKKKRRKKKNKNARLPESSQDIHVQDEYQLETEDGYYYDHYDVDDLNAIHEMPLNEDDYEFVSEIRLCGAVVEGIEKDKIASKPCEPKGNAEVKENEKNERIRDMKFLYGDSGSVRILKMEDTIEDCFKRAMKKDNGRKF